MKVKQIIVKNNTWRTCIGANGVYCKCTGLLLVVNHVFATMGRDYEDRSLVISLEFVVGLYNYWMSEVSMVSNLRWLFLRVDCILSEYAL